jgi:hypothetical protein
MSARRLVALLALVLAASLLAPPSIAASGRDLVRAACGLPHQWLLRTWRGWWPDRSGNLQIVPLQPNFVGSGLPHVGPWPYVQDVPMLWYGPGHIRAQGSVARPVTTVGIAPTQAVLLDQPFQAPDGQPMQEAIVPDAGSPPRLIVTIVWDAAGRNVLDAHPDAWPFLESLIDKGTWYEDMTVGSSPTSTAQIHANMGTGAFPNHHGLVGHRLDVGGRLAGPWAHGPNLILTPMLADVYDAARGNRPLVGLTGTVNIHFGMMSHGSFFAGGDRDIAMTRSVVDGKTLTDEGFEWNLPATSRPYYRLPPYLAEVPGFEDDVRAIDAEDGRIDGRWRDNEIEQLLGGFDTPARIPYQQRVLETLVEQEGFGADEVPDLLFANFKQIDYISHVWTMNSPEMRDAVEWQDAALRDLVRFLNRQVGRGEWVLALTADHGAIPDPAVSGAFSISTSAIASGINAAFDADGDDRPVVRLIQPTQIYLDEAELEEKGHTLEDVARWVTGLTKADTAPSGVTVPASASGDLVFEAAFPSSLMRDLPCLPEARS